MVLLCVLIFFILNNNNFVIATPILETIRALPTPLQFTVIHREMVEDSEGFARYMSYNSFWPGVRANRTLIEVFRVDDFTVDCESLWTDTSDEIRIKAVPKSRVIGGFFVDFTFRAEAKKSARLDEVFAKIMRTFGRSQAFETILCQNVNDNSGDRCAAALRGISKSQLRAKNIFIGTSFSSRSQPPQVTEESLLEVIHSAGARSINVLAAVPWNLSDAFYRNPAVQKLIQIDLQNVTANGITDDSLKDLNATSLILGNAPEITPAGLRRFFDPVFNGSLKERKIEFRPSFKAHTTAEIFKKYDYNVSQGVMFMLPSNLWIISPLAPGRKAILNYESKSNGLFCLKLSVY